MSHLLEPLFSAVIDVLNQGGVWAVFFLMILESACIPAPSELIMLYAGYLVASDQVSGVSQQWQGFVLVVVAGVAGNLIGSLIAWQIGASGGRTLLERHGKWFHISTKHLDWADSWFERHGPGTVFWTRVMPIIRTFISLPAGVARMPLHQFTLYTLLGCIPWVAMLGAIGWAMGDQWEKARDLLHYGDYLMVVAILAGLTWLVLRRRKSARPQ